MNKVINNTLLQELDSLLAKQGKSFESAVREYRASVITEITADESMDEKRWIEKFKKYRTRLDENTKAKPYQELSKLRDYLQGQNLIKPAPLLHLVDDSRTDFDIKKISIEIRKQIKY
ncbi:MULTISPECIES: hypothetical protein [unclassified Fibrobacter]|uniref:hypothetical protein n=1 Tax=unclassified Fibrobacter TaxID=2634177 RepID=UPI000D6CADFB|nr:MULTISPECIES: hypothetical protein [unclassified Fibrobacter]PWJ68285.1 hypothetical protein BGX12_10810 [Fibrobacter sp. UWR4]PZW65619.1 hypothetical protein C8E88_103010 [Fibrobacter sp. UWR1]